MARYRKCPRSCAQGKSCRWMSKMLQQVPPLKCPYFLKNVSSFMLWRPSNPCPRLEIPADFVQGHGDKFNDMVEVRGPCKSIWTMRVNILVCKHRRVMLDRGWRTLVNDLGLNQGDHVLFVLTAFSKFKVYVFDDVGIRRRLSSFQASYFNGNNNNNNNAAAAFPSATSAATRPHQQPTSFIWPNENHEKDFHGRSLSTERDLWEQEDGTVHEPWKRRLRGSSAAARPAVVDLSDDNSGQEPSESEYTLKGTEVQLEDTDTDSFQSSQRSAFHKDAFRKVSSASPNFIKKVPALSLKNESGPNCAHLEVPAAFTQRHDDLFKEHISLQGPTGRVWHVFCQITVQQQYKRVRLRAGWFDFAVDNMVKLHDQLLFTHVTEGQFRVQIVTKGHRRRGRPRRNHSSEIRSLNEDLRRTDGTTITRKYVQGLPKGIVHEDDTRMIRKDQMGTADTPRSNFQQRTINEECPLKSKIHQMQQRLLEHKRVLYRKVEDRYTSRRGRMEWGLGHS